ncbi:MAG: hemerythrin domain-containing protein [Flavobacteriales bacterium]|nr:hemerythrin domain-containing protein [Flavobacteriales bacterium]
MILRISFTDLYHRYNRATDATCIRIQAAGISAAIDMDNRTPKHHCTPLEDYSGMGLTALCDLIVDQHHNYVRSAIKQTEPMLIDLMTSVGKDFPFLERVLLAFRSAADELIMHLQREELVLFPYIRRLEQCSSNGTRPVQPYFGSVAGLLTTMEQEQERALKAIGHIRVHTSGFYVPEGAGSKFADTYARLEHFEADLEQHIHLEHCILFPRAIILEKELYERH